MHVHLIDELRQQIASYENWLENENLSSQTRRAYTSRLKRFRAFLDECEEPSAADRTRALKDIAQRFHDHLVNQENAKASSVNASITAVYHYYTYLGDKVPPVLRDWVLKTEPRVLTPEEQENLLSTLSTHTSVRDKALVTLLLFTGIRIGECRELTVGSVQVSAHTGKIIVSSRNRTRSIPINQITRQALLQWLIERGKRFNCDDDQPLFPNKTGAFMTRAAIDEIVRKVGRGARLNICAQVLRNTFLSTLLERGNKLELVAELGGQRKIEHVRRFRKGKNDSVSDSLETLLESPWNDFSFASVIENQ
jgi:site-specific recombinase XerD